MKDSTILFDLDGTIIDSTNAIVVSFQEAFLQNKFENIPTYEAISSLIGYPVDKYFFL